MTLYTVQHVTCDEFNAYRVEIFKSFTAHHLKVALPFVPAAFSKSESDCDLLMKLSNHYHHLWCDMGPSITPLFFTNPYSLVVGDFSIRFLHNAEPSTTRLRNHFFINNLSHQDIAYHLASTCALAAQIIHQSMLLNVA